MWRLHRYYSKDLLSSISLTFTTLFGISILAFLPRILHRTQGESLYMALVAALIWALDLLPELVMISALVGAVFSYARASADNEILAIRASGIHLSCPMGPALLFGVLSSVLCGWLVSTWIPLVHYKKYQLISSLANQILVSLAATDGRIELPGLSLVFDPAKRESPNRIRDVTIFTNTRQHQDELWAEELLAVIDGEREKLHVHLTNYRGWTRQGGEKKAAAGGLLEYTFDLATLLGDRSRKEGGDHDLRTSQIVSELLREEHPSPEKGWYVLHRRGCETIAPLVMTLLGFAIGMLFRRSGRMGAFAVSFAPLSIYFGLWIVTRSIVAATHVTALAWMPIGIVALGAVPLFWRVFRL